MASAFGEEFTAGRPAKGCVQFFRGRSRQRTGLTGSALLVRLLELPAVGRLLKKRPPTVVQGLELRKFFLAADEYILADPNDAGIAVAPHWRGAVTRTHTGVDGTLVFDCQVQSSSLYRPKCFLRLNRSFVLRHCDILLSAQRSAKTRR